MTASGSIAYPKRESALLSAALKSVRRSATLTRPAERQSTLDMADPIIHETAIISASASIDPSVRIGPGAVIEGEVTIGPNTEIGAYAIVREHTTIGQGNRIDAHVVIGGDPQHTAYDGSLTSVHIGDNNVLREYVTVNRGFEPNGKTVVGSNCYFMTCAHVGHDCRVGDNVVLTNNATLAGHVTVGRNVVMGGMAATHQFTRIGRYSMVAAFTPLRKDVLPFSTIGGTPVRHFRLNAVGLKRNGITGDRYRALESAFRALRAGDKSLEGVPTTDETEYLRGWLSESSRFGHYGFAAPRTRGR